MHPNGEDSETFTIGSILDTENSDERNRLLREAFLRPKQLLDVTGNEVQACCALINLTYKQVEKIDLTSLIAAKQCLKDKAWLNRCITQASHLHSHNLKYPDYRAKGSIRLSPIEVMPKGMLSSSVCNFSRLGWANNSADVNHAKLFSSYFLWQGKLLTLAQTLVEENEYFIFALNQLGLSKALIKQVINDLSVIPDKHTLWSLEDNSIPLLRFPYDDSYVHITPVASHEIQYQINQSVAGKYAEKMKFSRPSSVGSLVSSHGGNLNTILSCPKGLKHTHSKKIQQHFHFSEQHISTLRNWWGVGELLLTENSKKKRVNELNEQINELVSGWLSKQYDQLKNIPDTKSLTHKFISQLSKVRQLSFVYEPRFIDHIETCFGITSGTAKQSFEDDGSTYITLPSLHITNACAIPCAYLAGLPSLMGVLGFVHHFQRRFNNNTKSHMQIEAFAICLHDFSLHNRGLSKEFTAKSNKSISMPGVVDSRQCDLKLSLILKVSRVRAVTNDELVRALPMKLCDGAVHVPINELSNLSVHSCFSKAQAQLSICHGQWLVDKHKTHPIREANDIVKQLDKVDLVMTHTGYQFLEIPRAKAGSIDGLPHAFTEPVLSPAGLKSYVTGQNIDELFWQYRQQSCGLFLSSLTIGE